MNWAVALVSILGSLISGGGVVAAINALSNRKSQKVDAAANLNDSTLRWAEQMRKDIERLGDDAREARQEASEARREVADVRREMNHVRREFDEMATHMLNVKTLLFDQSALSTPELTIGRLRSMVSGIKLDLSGGGDTNGAGWVRSIH